MQIQDRKSSVPHLAAFAEGRYGRYDQPPDTVDAMEAGWPVNVQVSRSRGGTLRPPMGATLGGAHKPYGQYNSTASPVGGSGDRQSLKSSIADLSQLSMEVISHTMYILLSSLTSCYHHSPTGTLLGTTEYGTIVWYSLVG